MKKRLSLLVAVLLIVTLLAGCAGQTSTSPAPAEPVSGADGVLNVLVIGGGGAGLVSAITAAENGASVVLVEKMPALGGNTIISATGLTASDTALHDDAGIPFTVEDHIARTMEFGNDLPDLDLVTILAEESNAAYEWLVSLGLPLFMLSTANMSGVWHALVGTNCPLILAAAVLSPVGGTLIALP